MLVVDDVVPSSTTMFLLCMDRKTIGILTIIASTILCSLLGLAGLCFGTLALAGVFFPGEAVPAEDKLQVAGTAVMILGISLVFIAIPLGVGIWFWRKRKIDAALMQQLLIPEDDF
jgi:hypothetical protein